MDAYDAIVTKRDTRSYQPDPVEPELLERVLRAARMAGSAKNAQLTRLVVVTDPAIRTELTGCGDFTAWIDQAPVVVVLTCPVETGRLFDLGRMAQNLMGLGADFRALVRETYNAMRRHMGRPVADLQKEEEFAEALTRHAPRVREEILQRAAL